MKLYEDKDVIFEKFEDGTYRVTFFNEDCHWAGDITMAPERGVIHDAVKEEI